MPLNSRLWTAAVLLCAFVSCCVISGLLLFAMIGEINRKLRDEEQIPYFLGRFDKPLRVLREYRRLYPRGRLSLFYLLSVFVAVPLLLAAAWAIGFFH
jgi:hypothetical protein